VIAGEYRSELGPSQGVMARVEGPGVCLPSRGSGAAVRTEKDQATQ